MNNAYPLTRAMADLPIDPKIKQGIIIGKNVLGVILIILSAVAFNG